MKEIFFKLVALVAIALQPIYAELMAMLIFMGVDMVTGIVRSVKQKDFQVRKLAHSVGKFILYFTACIVAQIADIYFSFPKIAHVLISAIVLIELTSILDNIKTITGLDILGKLIGTLKR